MNDAPTPRNSSPATPYPLPGTTALCLSVAGVCLHFRGAERIRLAPPVDCYSTFLRASPADGPCIDTVEMEVIEGDVPRPDLLEPVFDTGDAWELWADDRRCVFRTRIRQDDGRPLWSMTVDRGFNHGRIYCSEKVFVSSGKSMLARHIVQYPLDQLLMIHVAAARSAALLLHAAGGTIDGAGVLFAGQSGAGKSTVSRLLDNGTSARFLSDDRIMLRRFGGRLCMYGTPWPGDAGIAVNESVPLKAVCFLRHADDTCLRRLRPAEVLQRLLPVASIPWYESALAEKALNLCEFLIDRYPAYELAFRPQANDLASVLDDFSAAA
ncbi:MAG: hypothetical protein BMS9Abin01_1633 [Gammaproteobacteria bacterium]|nr:MAG: hypothetical protein BMS9Abin01_1633 [Gammaproteobacteria bacterium]